MTFATPQSVREGRDEAHAKRDKSLQALGSSISQTIHSGLRKESQTHVYSPSITFTHTVSEEQERLMDDYLNSVHWQQLLHQLSSSGWQVEHQFTPGDEVDRDWQSGRLTLKLSSPTIDKP